MKRFFSVSLIAMCCAAWAQYVEIVPTSDKSYKVNELVTFNVTAWEKENTKLTSGTLDLTVTNSGGSVIGKPIVIDLAKNNPTTITAKLDRPGFILVRSSIKNAAGKSVKLAKKPASLGGAAVEPEKIQAGAGVPADFEKFWQDGIKAWKKAEVTVTPAPEFDKKNKCKNYRIKVTFPDKSGAIDGFLSVPAAPGKYPIIAGVPGAGPGQVAPGVYYVPSYPVIQLWMNVHLYPTAETAAEQRKRYVAYNKTCEKRSYIFDKALDREKYTYRRVWLSVNRALEYVMALPEFDGKNVAAVGSSQGGGTALALTYLNPRVTCTVSNVPALCDHFGWKADRQPGWPNLHKIWKGQADKNAPYFDGANFAAFIKVPVFMSAGYIDTTCSPSSVYAAFNNLKGEKTMFPMPREGHISTKEFGEAAKNFLTEHLNKK